MEGGSSSAASQVAAEDCLGLGEPPSKRQRIEASLTKAGVPADKCCSCADKVERLAKDRAGNDLGVLLGGLLGRNMEVDDTKFDASCGVAVNELREILGDQ
eukprot:277906-Amphidinium_carterae.1